LSCLHIWDLLIFWGRDILTHTCIALLDAVSGQLIEMGSFQPLVDELKKSVLCRYDSLNLAASVISRMKDLRNRHGAQEQGPGNVRKELESLRMYHAQLVMSESRRVQNLSKLAKKFRQYDTDRDGNLNKATFFHLLNDVFGLPSSAPLAVDEDEEEFREGTADRDLLSILWSEVDSNGDGIVSRDEFIEAGRQHPRLFGGLTLSTAAASGESTFDRLRHLFD